MNLQSILNSRRAGKLIFYISSLVPPVLGKRYAYSIADYLSTHNQLTLVQALRGNRWVISEGNLSSRQLDDAVKENLRHIAHSFYTLFHYIGNPVALQKLVYFSAQVEDLILRSQQRKAGVIVLGLHLSNFDLVFQAASIHGLRAVGLSVPEESEAIEWQHSLRRMAGLEILPSSISNFRQVINRLKSGETVVTGIDRPVGGTRMSPQFFGRPAKVPVHHIHLALKANVPVIIMGAILSPDGIYHIQSSDYIEMRHFSNHQTEIIWNAERVLEIAAGIIRQAPEQWAVIQPVWPDVLAEIPLEVKDARN